jgi:hypothetical protein
MQWRGAAPRLGVIEPVRRNAVERNAVQRNAVRRNAVERNAVERNAVRRNANVEHFAADERDSRCAPA